MEADKNELKLLQQAISEWEQEGRISPEQAADLRSSLTSRQSDRQMIAQYFFFVALFCMLMAFGVIFLNEKLLEKIKAYFAMSDLMISFLAAAPGAAWFWYTGKKRNRVSAIAYEVYMVLGGLAVLTSLVYLCKGLGIDKTYTAYLSMALPALMILAQLLRSQALWIGATITSIGWYGAVSTWMGSDHLFLGMNYPVRYAAFGLVVLAVAWLQGQTPAAGFGRRITYLSGLFIFFTGLWGMSVFGNYNSLEGWQQVKQVHVLAYSVVFGVAAALSFYLGIRYRDDAARDFGVLFLLINLYTRYFEFFWDTMNKGLFFGVLAATFGILGWWLERKRHAAAPVADAKKNPGA